MAETFPNAGTPRLPIMVRALLAVPVLGHVMRCFAEERVTELLWLAFTGALAAALALIVFGWPALITLALSLTALAGLIILSATFG